MNFKGIIFDLDGTLADTLADIAGSMNRVLQAHSCPVHPVDHYKLLVGRGLDKLVLQALPEYARYPEMVSRCLAEMMEDYGENCLVSTRLYEGIRDMLNALVALDLKLALCSNKVEPLTRKIVTFLMPDIPFVSILGARADYPKKPDPAGALQISMQMKTIPRDIIYVGDSDVDMITANRAGMFAVGVSWGFRTEQELLDNGAKIILDHPHELHDLVRQTV
jgi:phosphoglycolate phosphatase